MLAKVRNQQWQQPSLSPKILGLAMDPYKLVKVGHTCIIFYILFHPKSYFLSHMYFYFSYFWISSTFFVLSTWINSLFLIDAKQGVID